MTSSAEGWDTLTRLVAGEVVVPGSPGYDAVRKPAMARFHDVRPAAIVRCRTPADASAAIGYDPGNMFRFHQSLPPR